MQKLYRPVIDRSVQLYFLRQNGVGKPFYDSEREDSRRSTPPLRNYRQPHARRCFSFSTAFAIINEEDYCFAKDVTGLNILYCGDDKMSDGIFLSVLSLCRNTTRPLHIYILTASIGTHAAIPSAFAVRLETAMRDYRAENRVMRIDISQMLAHDPPTANMQTRFTPLCMLRLFADAVPEIPDRVLYLDADVLCRAPFAVMYDMTMEAYEVAGVPDRYGKWLFGKVWRHDYLNSGVLLLNMARIRESGLFSACRARCRDKKMFMPDQTALNKLAAKCKLPRRYNEQGRIRANTVFKHFTTYFSFIPYFHAVTVKPWNVEEMHARLGITEFDPILQEYTEKYK